LRPGLTQGHGTTIPTRFGDIRVERARGDGRRCKKWRFPADALLGLPDEGTPSPAVQEIAARTVSNMPAPEAQQVVERLAGVKISAATLARAARQPGQRAQEKRQALAAPMSHSHWPCNPLPWSSHWTLGTSANATSTGATARPGAPQARHRPAGTGPTAAPAFA
jgi:hypothetical protein